jgi:hypothetical protein
LNISFEEISFGFTEDFTPLPPPNMSSPQISDVKSTSKSKEYKNNFDTIKHEPIYRGNFSKLKKDSAMSIYDLFVVILTCT